MTFWDFLSGIGESLGDFFSFEWLWNALEGFIEALHSARIVYVMLGITIAMMASVSALRVGAILNKLLASYTTDDPILGATINIAVVFGVALTEFIVTTNPSKALLEKEKEERKRREEEERKQQPPVFQGTLVDEEEYEETPEKKDYWGIIGNFLSSSAAAIMVLSLECAGWYLTFFPGGPPAISTFWANTPKYMECMALCGLSFVPFILSQKMYNLKKAAKLEKEAGERDRKVKQSRRKEMRLQIKAMRAAHEIIERDKQLLIAGYYGMNGDNNPEVIKAITAKINNSYTNDHLNRIIATRNTIMIQGTTATQKQITGPKMDPTPIEDAVQQMPAIDADVIPITPMPVITIDVNRKISSTTTPVKAKQPYDPFMTGGWHNQ